MTPDRLEAFKLYNDMAKQVLTLASALLVAIVGAFKLIAPEAEIGVLIKLAVGLLIVSILGGVFLMGALTANLSSGRPISAPEISIAGQVQLVAFFVSCALLGLDILIGQRAAA